ncbi:MULTISPECIES: zinc-binding alcohol dehydrogenase family protein [Pseudoxanthomonas]|uniref:Zinc-type alcohol dehydrogenase-like protein n=1 Tax=Pseudoxanthomonas winnipegensis TaxID=2480810 RepID=A0AAW8GEC1_9GAMM|nr:MULTISPECIES: zinc-binding alcohol dehydrogenase family protein [Pseudoxanthomonas]MDQ1120831.1 zinc-binding alcohol dehydrogenase family protein [Pseudoxanthomonas winnipegensis]MDQ1134056.1 zinc-binding alcohol dehydrogenase family protein [Pseudoxanthomonas winnipegensis]MDR6139708.1 zinc-binding alcohol dehydrogenase family protein [Pseudoxanthomonas sp. SORGH_AS_0997]
MKAVAYLQAGLPIDDPAALVDVDLPQPVPGPRDLLVKVHAVSVNPVDTKVRHRAQVTEPRVLGWDAVGTVEAVGEAVTLFKPGEVVYYAGSINRPGSNAQYQLVDERIVARKPASLDDAQAAALPLTAITAWELLFDRLRIPEGQGEGQVLLVTGAAGGVGSILVQLARKLTALTVVGTASRPETQAWVRELGAHHVIDHSQPLGPQLQALGIEQVQHVASLTHTGSYYSQFIELLAPQGQLALIDDLPSLDAMPLKPKSISLHWESMFTRSVFQTPDMQAQHDLLTRVAALIDAGTLRTTFGEHYGTISAANLRRAHALVESGKAKGKLVLEGFD